MRAQVGSIFEFANRNAIFGVVKPDNFLWAPILLFFAITGLPSAGAVICAGMHGADASGFVEQHVLMPLLPISAGYLFLRAINAANKDSERQDKLDGY